jgi:ferredoxin-NADP reductase
MYRFKSGKFAGMTVEQAMLRDASRQYSIADWATDKPHLRRMVKEFEALRRKLRRARICKLNATFVGAW